jgi:hypothetical protein
LALLGASRIAAMIAIVRLRPSSITGESSIFVLYSPSSVASEAQTKNEK